MNFEDRPIQFKYAPPELAFLAKLKSNHAITEIYEQSRLKIENRYFQNKIPGSIEKVYVRMILLTQIQKALNLLNSEYGFTIYDAYRSKETQAGLFESYLSQIRLKYPDCSQEKVISAI